MGRPGPDEGDPDVRRLIDGARGSISASTLSRVGKRRVRWGTFHDRPLVEYLREDEQPHFVLAHAAGGGGEFEFDDYDHRGESGYWQSLAVTDQRLLVIAGFDDGDRGEVIPYGVVDPGSLEREDEAFQDELEFVANGVEVEIEDYRTSASDVAAAAEYVADRARAAGGPDADHVAEADRPRGPVYEIPNLSIPATIWRPDDGSDDAGRDESTTGDFAVPAAGVADPDPPPADELDADDSGGPDLSVLDADPPSEEELDAGPAGPDLSVLDDDPPTDDDGDDDGNAGTGE